MILTNHKLRKNNNFIFAILTNYFAIDTYNYSLPAADYSKAEVSLSHGSSLVDIRYLSTSVTVNKNKNSIYYLGFLLKESFLSKKTLSIIMNNQTHVPHNVLAQKPHGPYNMLAQKKTHKNKF